MQTHIDIQRDRERDRQTDRQTDRGRERQTDRQTVSKLHGGMGLESASISLQTTQHREKTRTTNRQGVVEC